MAEAVSPRSVLDAAIASGMRPADVLAMRRVVYTDGGLQQADADLLCEALEAVGDGACDEWSAFFVEAMTDWMVLSAMPRGYIAEDRGLWFARCIAHDGIVTTRTGFDALVYAMERARRVPASLTTLAIATVRAGFVENRGPLAHGGAAPFLTAEDVTLIRRTLFAAAGEGTCFVSRAEAEALFDIAEATAGRTAGSGFEDLFARAVGNHLLAAGGVVAPDAGEALRRERWLDDRQPLGHGIGEFFARALTAAVGGDSFSTGGWVAGSAAQHVLAETIDEVEAAWLVARLHRDGGLSDAEKRLLRFLKTEAPARIPASLQPLLAVA